MFSEYSCTLCTTALLYICTLCSFFKVELSTSQSGENCWKGRCFFLGLENVRKVEFYQWNDILCISMIQNKWQRMSTTLHLQLKTLNLNLGVVFVVVCYTTKGSEDGLLHTKHFIFLCLRVFANLTREQKWQYYTILKWFNGNIVTT